jgi:hypothetical protein
MNDTPVKAIDRATFFAYARRAPFGNRLTQQQVDGMNAILDLWTAEYADQDIRWLAYILATAFHETGGRMVAVREGFARTDAGARRIVGNRRYGRSVGPYGHAYYGRGHVQLTWMTNYQKMGDILGIDLVANPDLALDPTVSVRILFEGMMDARSGVGDFTEKALDDYFNETTDDPEGARRIVNGTDKKSLIASYHRNFLDSLTAAIEAARRVAPPPPTVVAAAQPDGPDLATDSVTTGGVIAGLGGAAAVLGPVLGQVNNVWAFALMGVIVLGVFMVITGRISIKRKAGA